MSQTIVEALMTLVSSWRERIRGLAPLAGDPLVDARIQELDLAIGDVGNLIVQLEDEAERFWDFHD